MLSALKSLDHSDLAQYVLMHGELKHLELERVN